MAAWEPRKEWVISQVSWMDGTTQDVYYWQEHSFQYSANINCDDEMHGIKLSNKADFTDVANLKNCQLVSAGKNGVIALNTKSEAVPHIFNQNNFSTWWTSMVEKWRPDTRVKVCPGVVFQDYFWYGATVNNVSAVVRVNNTGAWTADVIRPCDHSDYTDEAISTPEPIAEAQFIDWSISAILNYNNTRLVVAVWWGISWTSIWVYYPELDKGAATGYTYLWATWWKKVLDYEAWVEIVAMTCTFEYLKVWAVDEWWNTKVYYYQGNNNLRSTFVYNVVDLTWVRVTRVYSINGTDYYVSSQDWTDGFVNLYKMVGNTPVSLFHQRAWLDELDVNFKAPYFVGPCSIGAGYTDWTFYIADTYGLFRFRYTPDGYDKGYMKWKFNSNQEQPTWVCFNQGYLYVSTDEGCYKMRAYDTWIDGYQDEWVLISREYEGKEGWTITKMLDEIRLNYELNPLTSWNGTIDVYISPNNLWKNTRPEWTWLPVDMSDYEDDDYDWWYHVMHITQTNIGTRTERSNLLNNLHGDDSSFEFDWQTITYAIVISTWSEENATPIVRQIDIKYHTKDKVNKVYNIK